MMPHCSTDASVLPFINLSWISQERLPELELSHSRTPHSSENITASHTQLQPHNENQGSVLTALVPSSLGLQVNQQVNFAVIIHCDLYKTGLY